MEGVAGRMRDFFSRSWLRHPPVGRESMVRDVLSVCLEHSPDIAILLTHICGSRLVECCICVEASTGFPLKGPWVTRQERGVI